MTDLNRSFQHYEVLRREDGSPWELGRGAMGITYKAFDVNLCCEVALKVVNSALLDHPDARERFVREARAAAALRHRNVASVYHLGNDGEHFFYAMEFIDGETLDALVRRHGPLPVDVVLRMLGQVSRALVAADRQHLVHRDLKPSNLMVVHEDADEEMTVKVIDFGLARPAMGSETTAQVTLGGFVGTPQYASPEQLEERGLDARSDIYSLGVTAWYLLTGQPPFSGSLASVCQQQLGQAPPWEFLPPGLPVCVHDLLAHMLEKSPAKRPQTARALREEIDACQSVVPQQPWQLPTIHGTANAPMAAPGGTRAARRTVGGDGAPASLADGRYTLLRLLEEGHGTRVYQARDELQDARIVTLRTLPFQLTRDPLAQAALAEDIRLIQAAAHTRLIRVLALEPVADKTPAFLVEESLQGFSLRDLLAVGGGSLDLGAALRLLEQAAAAADHAESRRLEHLDLALHHLRVHFPYSDPHSEFDANRTFLSLPMPQWPDWGLKVHPFAVEHGTLEHHTWAGDVTLLPGGLADAGGADAPEGSTAERYVCRLAGLTYELLGGTPHPNRNGSLSALNEAGNDVLSQALAAPGVFKSCRAFYEALAATRESSRGGASPKPASAGVLPSGAKTGAKITAVRETALVGSSSLPSKGVNPGPGAAAVRGSAATLPETESVAALFQPSVPVDSSLPDEPAAGSAWQRLSMVGGEPTRPGRWLLAAFGVVLLFAGVFAGVLALLLHGGSKDARVKPEPRAAGQKVSPAGTVAQVTSAAQARNLASPPSLPVSAPPVATPDASPLVTVRDVRIPPVAPSPAASNVAAADAGPPASPSPEKLVALQLDSAPRGAEIRLHGKLLGKTPFEAQLPPGDYELIANYRNWPVSGKTVHLDAGQTRATSLIAIMPPGLDPLNAQTDAPHGSKALSPVPESRVRRALPVRGAPVQPSLPSAPAAPAVRRPLPLDPFEAGQNRTGDHNLATPAPTVSEDE